MKELGTSACDWSMLFPIQNSSDNAEFHASFKFVIFLQQQWETPRLKLIATEVLSRKVRCFSLTNYYSISLLFEAVVPSKPTHLSIRSFLSKESLLHRLLSTLLRIIVTLRLHVPFVTWSSPFLIDFFRYSYMRQWHSIQWQHFIVHHVFHLS